MQIEQILKVAVRGGASDIILKVGSGPKFRFNGNLVPLSDGETITAEAMEAWISSIIPPNLKERFHKTGDIDFAMETSAGYRFRVNVYKQRQKYGIVMRVISNHIRTIEELQLPQVLRDLAMERRGLILVTGVTGSGKSTTLASMLQRINVERAAHVVTIEDPIEFNFVDAVATFTQREVGLDTMDFSSALRAALRQNPDVIFVGELRDEETCATALQAAETGHLVFSTLHTGDAVESLNRILSFFPPHHQATIRAVMASTLRAVISQRLVQRASGKGQIAAMEILVSNSFVKDSIAKGAPIETLRSAIESGHETYGMQSFDQSLLELFRQGMISEAACLEHATSASNMQLQLQGLGTFQK